MTHVCRPHNTPNLVHRSQIRAKSSMRTEDLIIYNSSNRQTVETINECLPELYIIPSFTFVVESIDAIDGCTFVIPPQNEEVLRVLDLVG